MIRSSCGGGKEIKKASSTGSNDFHHIRSIIKPLEDSLGRGLWRQIKSNIGGTAHGECFFLYIFDTSTHEGIEFGRVEAPTNSDALQEKVTRQLGH